MEAKTLMSSANDRGPVKGCSFGELRKALSSAVRRGLMQIAKRVGERGSPCFTPHAILIWSVLPEGRRI